MYDYDDDEEALILIHINLYKPKYRGGEGRESQAAASARPTK